MIRVVRGALEDREEEGVVRPIRADLAPVTTASRDVGVRAGSVVAERLSAAGAIPVGGAVLTDGGDLPAPFLIHVVTCAPDEPESLPSLRRALRNGLRRAADWGLGSLAVPPLGIGAGTLDAEEAARTLVDILARHVDEGHDPLDLAIVAPNDYEEGLFTWLVGELVRDRTSVAPGHQIGVEGGRDG